MENTLKQQLAVKNYTEKVLKEQLAIKERELAEVDLRNRQLIYGMPKTPSLSSQATDTKLEYCRTKKEDKAILRWKPQRKKIYKLGYRFSIDF